MKYEREDNNMIIGTLYNGKNVYTIYQARSKQRNRCKALYMATMLEEWQKANVRSFITSLSYDKDSRTDHEKEVFDEVKLLQQTYPSIKVKKVIFYSHLEKLMRVTHNPDFFAGLPIQTAQAVVKHAVTDFSNWLKALKDYKSSPSKYLGRPQMPHCRKQDAITFSITNHNAVLYFTDRGTLLKLPGIKERLKLVIHNIKSDHPTK